jgi:hypothetical protein
MRSTFILGGVASMFLLAGIAAADDTDKLIELDKKWGQAEGADAIAPLLADDILAIGVEGLGSKNEMLEEAESAEPATGPYEAGDYKVEFLNDDIAIMVHSTGGAEPHWSMHVWQKQDGNWRVAATASVPIQE